MNVVINRKDAIGAILSVGHIAELSDGDAVIRVSAVNYVLRNMPPAQPEHKTGQWVTKLENHTYECSECGNEIITNKDYLKKHKFCFCCGAKMLKECEGRQYADKRK